MKKFVGGFDMREYEENESERKRERESGKETPLHIIMRIT